MRLKLYLGLALLLSGCTGSVSTLTTDHYTQTVQSWRGGQASALVARWGRPDMKMRNREGNTIYTYQTQSYANYSVQSSSAVGVNVSRSGRPLIVTQPNSAGSRNSISSICYATFVANAKGVITSTQIQGSGCYAGQGFAKSKGNPHVG